MTVALLLQRGVGVVAAGTLQLQGTVSSICELQIEPAPGHGNLDLAGEAVDLRVLTAHERSNAHGGYTVTLESASAAGAGSNTPALRNMSAGTDRLDYTMKYDGVPVVLGNRGVVGRATVTDQNSKTPSGGSAKALQISHAGSQHLASGIYQDTLTFTISAK